MNTILIAGPSGSGKSTVAWRLAQELNYAWFCLDGYFMAPMYVTYGEKEYKTFEHPCSYDAKTLYENILTFQEKNAKWVNGIVVEGFCILNYPEIFRLTTKRFFLDASHEFCVTRRIQRTGGKSIADKTYLAIGKEEASKYVYCQRNMSDVITIDATLDLDTILNKIKINLN
jgi:uridine kinase